jgi:hypothetical protein
MASVAVTDLVARMFVEPQKPPIIFDLPPKKRYRPDPNLDTNMKIARANRPYYADSLFGCFLFLVLRRT